MITDTGKCHICGEKLRSTGGLNICPACNDSQNIQNPLGESISIFGRDTDRILIECPGATLYHPGTNEVSAGVKFNDDKDASQGFEIIKHPVYGPKHVRRRWVKKEDIHLIRRCQSCQDHTIRNRRKEGPDLYIPSIKNPRPKHHRYQSFPPRSRS